MSVLVVAGAANALARPIASAIQEHGVTAALSSTLGVNPAIWAALMMVLQGIYGNSRQLLRRSDIKITVLFLCALLIPSATISWISLTIFSVWLWQDAENNPAQRSGAAVLFVLAGREPLLSLLTHFYNTPLLALDAALTASAVNLFDDGIFSLGNFVMGPEGVRLVVLTSCSSLANLSYALLFWYATCRTLMPHFSRITWISGALIAACVVALNVGRLALMASSEDMYELVHGTTGRSMFSLLMLTIVVGLTLLGGWHVINGRTDHRAVTTAHSGQPSR